MVEGIKIKDKKLRNSRMLHLAKDGIFPITKDKDGKLLKELPRDCDLRKDMTGARRKLNTFLFIPVSRM